jgi:metal-responsive CopG/Arc/MetJ family transcriptional regulator
MPRKNEQLKVGISIFLPSTTLDQIEETIEGKSRSEKIRNLIELGLQATHRNKGIRSTRSLSQPP